MTRRELYLLIRRQKVSLLLLGLLAIFLVDRYAIMPDRLKGIWEFQKGAYIRDPIVYRQHFSLKGSIIVFKSGEKFILVGCYFGQLFMYDPIYGDISRYSRF